MGDGSWWRMLKCLVFARDAQTKGGAYSSEGKNHAEEGESNDKGKGERKDVVEEHENGRQGGVLGNERVLKMWVHGGGQKRESTVLFSVWRILAPMRGPLSRSVCT